MTNTEAIETLRANYPDACYEQLREAVDVAISSLKRSENVRSEWIQNDNETWSCKRCHSWIPNEQHEYARYCLCCGAKMDEN